MRVHYAARRWRRCRPWRRRRRFRQRLLQPPSLAVLLLAPKWQLRVGLVEAGVRQHSKMPAASCLTRDNKVGPPKKSKKSKQHFNKPFLMVVAYLCEELRLVHVYQLRHARAHVVRRRLRLDEPRERREVRQEQAADALVKRAACGF